MKVNLKKIGAIVAGATILASSVSFAGLMFGSTQLVDDNGAPVAKVVVGENAAASDGVAAGLIASKLVSKAYKMSNITAEVSGTATCDAGAGDGGSCTVSDEMVTLEVTVPGAVAAGTYTIGNLIGDYLNRDLLDRDESQTNYSLGGSDTTDPSNPWKNGDGAGGDLGITEIIMHRVSGSMFSPLATSTVTDADAARTYSEQQDIWLKGDNVYSASNDDVVGRLNFVTYSLKFKGAGDDLGIPVCTTPTNSTMYAHCIDDYKTATHKVKIKFLGEDWIISEMQPPGVNLASDDESILIGGGMVKLAKESVSGILNQGESLTVDDLKFQLDDLEAHGDTTAAIISVLDANDNVLKKDKVTPATTKEFNVQGTIYRFHVYKVAPGYTFGAKWADVAVFSKELKLQHNQELDPDYDNNDEWRVYLGWKNKGGDINDNYPDHLRTILLHADDPSELSSGGETEMEVGDFIPIVQDPVKWKLSYNGLNIGGDERDFLKFNIETSTRTLSASSGPLNSTGGRVRCNISAPYVKVKSGKSGSTFEVINTGISGTGQSSDDEFLIAVGGASCEADIPALNNGTLFMRLSPTSDYWTYRNYVGEQGVRFAEIGDGTTTWAKGGMLVYAHINDANTTGHIADSGLFNSSYGAFSGNIDWVFGISENAGTGVSLGMPDRMYFGLDLGGTPSDADFNIDVTQAGNPNPTLLKKDNIKYQYVGPVDSGMTTAEEGFITERGSVFRSIDKSTVNFDMANELARAQWFLASVSANATPGTTQLTLEEGETGTVSGVTITAKSIDQTAVCAGGAGGSPACTPNMAGVSAVLKQDGVAVTGDLEAAMPYDFSKYTPLVMLDTDARTVSTVISVGGDAVNMVTKTILAGADVDWDAQPKMVKEVVEGSKIVVAGKTASDTMDAADDFISQLG